LIKYIKSVLWRVANRLSYTEVSWFLKVHCAANPLQFHTVPTTTDAFIRS